MGKASKALACIYKPLGWFPVIVINGIAVWSYFAYVVILCFDVVKDPWERGLYLVFYHPFFLMFMISYWQAIMASPGYIPTKFYLSRDDTEKYENAENPQEVIDEIAKELPVQTYSVNKAARFCEQCHAVKPDRSHHCSMCQRCVLKMDHHCPWVNNCVGWGNYKYFVLFLAYAILYTMYVTFTTLQYFIKFWSSHMKANSSLHILFLFFVAAMFSISLWSLFGFHIFLTLNNRSTLESFRAPIFEHGPDKNGFNLGKMNNFKQVFGAKKWKWFLPIFSTMGNGYTFRTSRQVNNGNEPLIVTSFDYDDDTINTEKDGLLEHEEPTTIYNTSTFVNGDINLKLGHESDSDDEIVNFDASNLKGL